MTLPHAQDAERNEIRRYRKGRALKARNLLAEAYDKHDIETSVADMLADLMHLCEQRKFDFLAQYERARKHHNVEIIGGEHG